MCSGNEGRSSLALKEVRAEWERKVGLPQSELGERERWDREGHLASSEGQLRLVVNSKDRT